MLICLTGSSLVMGDSGEFQNHPGAMISEKGSVILEYNNFQHNAQSIIRAGDNVKIKAAGDMTINGKINAGCDVTLHYKTLKGTGTLRAYNILLHVED